jgi:hypothetical protein
MGKEYDEVNDTLYYNHSFSILSHAPHILAILPLLGALLCFKACYCMHIGLAMSVCVYVCARACLILLENCCTDFDDI